MTDQVLEFFRARQPVIRHAAAYILKILLIAIVYHLAARLGLRMAYVQINTSPVWPPTGIALAALLIFGYQVWPAISLGVLLGFLFTGADTWVALGITLGNTLEALVGAHLLRRFVNFHNVMDRIQDVTGLALVSLLSAAISATIGIATLLLTGSSDLAGIGGLWSTWWIGDLLGALVVAPVILVWATPPLPRRLRSYLEGGILMVLLSYVAWYVFGSRPLDAVWHQAMIYMIFPFVIWAALRLGQHGATLAVLLVSGIAIWGTVHGLGPFSLGSKNDSLVLLQTFMAVVSLTALILAAATLERQKAAEALKHQADELATLNDSSKMFLDNFEIASIYHTICHLAVSRLGLDAAWIETPDGEGDGRQPLAIAGLSAEGVASQETLWEKDGAPRLESGVRIQTAADLPALDSRATAFGAYAAFSLLFSNRPIGTLKLLSRRADFFSEDRQMLIRSYANLAAEAIQNTLLLEEVRMSNRQLHALSQRLMKAHENERLNLSRELHDESGQLLAALTVQLGLLERDADHPELIHTRIAGLKTTANTIQENLHRLAVALRPASLDHLGLVTTLQQYIQEFSRQHNIKVDFEAVGIEDKRLPIETETTLFRIVQESLTNVVLHAQAKRVDVLLSLRGQHVSAIIEDDGVGFIPTSASFEDQLGLFGMRERVEMLGGTFTIESSPGQGTTVKAEIPFDD